MRGVAWKRTLPALRTGLISDFPFRTKHKNSWQIIHEKINEKHMLWPDCASMRTWFIVPYYTTLKEIISQAD